MSSKGRDAPARTGSSLVDSAHSPRLLEAVFRNATVAMFVMDERQHCIYMNPAAERLTGFTLPEVQGRALHDVIHHTRPDGTHYPLEECPIDRAFPADNREQGEEVFVHKDGGFYPVAYTASPIREDEAVVGTIIEVRDLTQEKQAEAAFQAQSVEVERRAKQQAALSVLGRYALRGPGLLELMDYAVRHVAETLDMELCKVLERLPDTSELLLRAGVGWKEGLVGVGMVPTDLESQAGFTLITNGPVVVEDLRTETRFSGPALLHEHGVVSGMSVTIDTPEGPYGVLGVHTREGRRFARGETDFLQAVANTLGEAVQRLRGETRLQEINVTLEQRVGERTRLLEEANHELEAFAYSVSHDLRAPLRSIGGFGQILMEDYGDTLNADAKGCLERIQTGAMRMGELIDDLLELSHLNRREVRRAHVDLGEMAVEVARELNERQPDRPVAFEAQGDGRAVGDPQLLRIVLENVLENAWKYTAHREDPRVEFGVQATDGQKVFFVRDNGAGFDMKYANKLFVPFGRLHSEREFKGTGIGLATVLRIIHRHGGRIWAEGTPGAGATFWFMLDEAEERSEAQAL